MDKHDDIYKHEATPSLAGKRRRRSDRRRKRGKPSIRPEHASEEAHPRPRQDLEGARPARHPRDYNALDNRQRSRRRQRRRKRSEHEMTPRNKLIWGGLVAAVGLYFIFLILANVAQHKEKTKPSQKTAAAETESDNALNPEMVLDTETAEQLRSSISEWEASYRMIEGVDRLFAHTHFEMAFERMEAALGKAPDNIDVQFAAARLYAEHDRPQRAEELLLKLLAANPRHAETQLLLTNVLMDQQKYLAAIEVGNWLLDRDPYVASAHELVARAYLKTEQTGKAIPHLRKAMNLNSDNTAVRNNLAMIYTRLKEYDKAIEIFSELLESKQDSTTYYNLAVCHAQQMQVGEAVEILAQAAQIYGDSFIRSWMRSDNFAPIRDGPLFLQLEETVMKGSPSTATSGKSTPSTSIAGQPVPQEHTADFSAHFAP